MLKHFCAETRNLRETISRRIAAVGGHIDDDSLPDAEAIVDSMIGEFLFAPNYAGARRKLAEGRASDSRVLTLLVIECLARIGVERPAQRTTEAA